MANGLRKPLFLGTCISIIAAASVSAGAVHAQDAAPQAAQPDAGEIIVTARKREETLMDVPVAVSALSGQDIARYGTGTLTKLGDMVPTVIISSYRSLGGGSVAIRGISSPATQVGFEQPVSVAIDGVQISSGRIATIGFFDLKQVEVLKGPQALFFGKNSPAGVISLTTAGGTDQFEAGIQSSYEFVGDETTTEAFVSGPLADGLTGRVAMRYRKLQGWMHNDARETDNPFYRPNQPAGAARVPGSLDDRLGDEDIMGRLSLQYEDGNFKSSAKLFGYYSKDPGAGSAAQSVGPCPGGRPRAFGIVDPFGECKVDNRMTFGGVSPTIAASFAGAPADGHSFGRTRAIVASWTNSLDVGGVDLTSVTGYSRVKYRSFSGLDQTTFASFLQYEEHYSRSFSQEVRALSKFDGPINFLVGGFYQKSLDSLVNDIGFRGDLAYVNGRYDTYIKEAYLRGTTLSAFGQLIWNITPQIELVGGARWTREKKFAHNQNIYGTNTALGRFDTLSTIFATSIDQTPGVLAGRFRDSNISPEVTLSWHPERNMTLYAAYKTGFKSGGFGITSPMQTSATLASIDFNSEKVRGFELGAKGELFDRRLRLTAAAFAYDFKDLQVTTYDASTISFNINNAGKLKQRGVEVEGSFAVTDILTLRGAVSYVHNRFANFIGQCYGYNIPVAQAQTAAPPPNCSFVLNAAGGRQLTATGAPILQQVLDGRAPARSPDWSGNAGFTAAFPVMGNKKLSFTGDAVYSGSYYAGDTFSPASLQDSFWRLNGSIRLAEEDQRWELALIGRNLTNKYYLLFAGDRTGGASVPLALGEQRGVVGRGREVSLQASVHF